MAVPNKLFSIATILQRGVDLYPELTRRWTNLQDYLQQYAADHTHSGGPDGALIVGNAAGVTDSRTFTNTSYLDLDALTGGSGSINAISTSVTVTVDCNALIAMGCRFHNGTGGGRGDLSLKMTGATSFTAADAQSFSHESGNAGDRTQASLVMVFTLNAGTTTIELQAKTTTGTQTIENPR